MMKRTITSITYRDGRARFSRARALCAAAALAVGVMGAVHPAQADGFWQDVQKRGSLRCAFASSPPYTMKDIKTGEYGGAYLDLCKQFAQVLGVKAEFVDTTWDNIVAGLQAGKWDMSPALNRTSTRAMAITYSSTVGYDETNLAFLTANAKVQNAAPDLAVIDKPDVRVGVMSGTAQDKAISTRLKQAQIVRLPTAESLNLALLSGRIDVLGADSATNQLLQLAHTDKVKLVDANPPLMKQGISFGLPPSVTWRDAEVLDVFLEERVALGEVDAALKHYSQVMLDTGQQ